MVRAIWLAMTMILGIIFSQQIVQAEGLGGPNTGEYVYQDQEYITNGQSDQLDKINDQIDRGANPQKLYLIIYDNDEDASYINRFLSVPGHKKYLISEYAGRALYGDNTYYNMNLDGPTDYDIQNNYLIMDLQDNRVILNPSLQGSLYLTDLLLMKAEWGLRSQLYSDNTDTKIAALFALAKKLEPSIQKVADNEKMLNYPTIDDIKSKVQITLGVIGIIIVLIILYAIHRHNRNHPHRGGGLELGNSDYDAGFDEGYYMGSNDPFM